MPADASTILDWVKALGPSLAAIIIVVGGYRFNRKNNEALAKLNSTLTRSMHDQLEADRADRTTALEAVKRDLQDTLAARARRADYLRMQIDKLYGPLAFFVESSARCIDTNRAVMMAYDEYFAKFRPGPEKGQEEIDRAIEAANRYIGLVVENNKETMKLLRAAWGWLDADDIEETGQYLTDVARHAVEFEVEKGKGLPVLFYFKGAIENALSAPSFIRPDFIERVRRKLREKQAELSGLTGVD